MARLPAIRRNLRRDIDAGRALRIVVIWSFRERMRYREIQPMIPFFDWGDSPIQGKDVIGIAKNVHREIVSPDLMKGIQDVVDAVGDGNMPFP